MPDAWSLDMGATPTGDGVQFRVWAPAKQRVEVEVASADRPAWPMDWQADGVWIGRVPTIGAGARYKFRLDGQAFPDPYSRFQPEGVHGPSEVIDARQFQWANPAPSAASLKGQVIYELHTGAFTPEGTFDAAISRLPYLRDLGVTAVEIMPVGESSGRRNWGYDMVDWFAPASCYGGPEAFRRLVDAAHGHGLIVLLDVIYNHFGPEGNYLAQYSQEYFTERYHTPWGPAINYEGCPWARQLAVDNARYWVTEFHVDGFRCDATNRVHDASAKHILRELGEELRAVAPGALLIAETEENDVRYLRPAAQGGHGFDAVWADDFHHAVRRRLAGDHEGWYEDYQGTVEEIAQTINHGFLYEGQYSPFEGAPRGTAARDRPAWQFVYCIQNHDQVGNRAFGDRLNQAIGLDAFRVASMLLLLVPETPMLFMGQEFAASSPFQYFTDHPGDLGAAVTRGRREEFKHFAAFSQPGAEGRIPDPQAESTFLNSKLRWQEVEQAPHREIHELYRQLLRLRREDAALAAQDRPATFAAAITPDVLALGLGHGSRVLLANFSQQQARLGWELLGRPGWDVLLDSNDGRFGGSGKRSAHLTDSGLDLDGLSAVLLARIR